MKILIDKQEKKPWTFAGLDVEPISVSMKTGDYQLPITKGAVVERKSLQDYVGTLGADTNRERFLREMERMSSYAWPLIVVEAPLQDLVDRKYISKCSPDRLFDFGTLIQQQYQIPILWAGSRRMAELATYRHFRAFIRYHAGMARKIAQI